MDNEIKKILRATADKLRSNMDATEYKHIVLGMIFLKYISDSFAEHWNALPRSLRVSGFSIRIKDFAVGSDADNVIFDSEKEHTFRRRKRAHECPLCVLRRLENEG